MQIYPIYIDIQITYDINIADLVVQIKALELVIMSILHLTYTGKFCLCDVVV